MKAVISIPARMTSTRFPGKVLAEVADGVPALAFLIGRLRSAAECVVVTGAGPEDGPIVDLCRELGVEAVLGAHGDMVAQHRRVADARPDANLFLMAGADDPLLDPALFRRAIGLAGGYDYLRTAGWPLGLNLWAWSRRAIREADRYARAPEERQHVVPFWERRPDVYPSAIIAREPDLYDAFRVTVDDGPDLQLVRLIVSALPEGFGNGDIIDLMERHPELDAVNANGLRGYAARDALYDIRPLVTA